MAPESAGTNYYYVTYGSIYGDDPKSAVNRLVREVTAINKGETPATGSFIPGADLVDGLVAAIKGANGSTKGAVSLPSSRSSRGSGDLGEDHLLQDRPRRHGSCVPRDAREQQQGEVRPVLEDEEARKASVSEVGAGRDA